jgi:hypothetical protein
MKDTTILCTTGYPPMNYEKFKKGSKQNFNAKNKQIYIIEYDMEVEELMGMAKHAFKILLRQKLGLKTFMLWVPDEEASINTMRRYKQILATHLAMMECVSSIELAGIMDLDGEHRVSVTNQEGATEIKNVSVRSVLMDIKVPGTNQPLFLMITSSRAEGCEGLLPTGRIREEEAQKVALHVASSVMYRMMFEVLVDPLDIADVIKCGFSLEHAKVAMEYSSYVVDTRTVNLHTSSGLSNADDDMRDLEEDWIDMSILENTAVLEIGNMDSGVIFDHDKRRNDVRSARISLRTVPFPHQGAAFITRPLLIVTDSDLWSHDHHTATPDSD